MSEDKNRKKSIFRRVKRDNVTDTPSKPINRGDDMGYSAYTTPVENDYSPYSPQTPSSTIPALTGEEERPKGKKTGIAKFLAIGLVALALIIISSLATYLFSHYDFQLSSGNGAIKLSLIPRVAKIPQGTPNSNSQNLPSVTPSPTTVPQVTPVQSAPPVPSWDGTSMYVSSASSGKLTLQQIFKKCAPSVAAIHAENQDGSQNGAGVILSTSGYIVTNQHIVYGASTVTVTLFNGDKYTASYIGQDEQTDLAVIKINSSGLTPAEFADLNGLEVGDSVVAIGNVINQTLSMTDGIITSINRDVSYNGLPTTLLQTNASINSGNSGGPLINMNGQVVGIANAALVSSFSSVKGIGFAIPASSAKQIVDQLMQDGVVKGRPSLGLRVSDIAASAYIYYKLPKGVYVSRVYTNTDAYAKGIQQGDIICSVNDNAVGSSSDFTSLIYTFAVGDTVKVKVYRGGNYTTLDIKLVDQANLK